jgi:hypothetical protein
MPKLDQNGLVLFFITNNNQGLVESNFDEVDFVDLQGLNQIPFGNKFDPSRIGLALDLKKVLPGLLKLGSFLLRSEDGLSSLR